MEEINLDEIKAKTTTNILFLSLRNIAIQAISFLGFFLLTILLKKEEIGLFSLIVEIIGILGYFSDIGLAAALIQQKETVTKEELRTTFFIQQTLVALSLIVFWSFFYKSVASSLFLAIALCFSYVCASLKTIPSVLLERKLNFKILSMVDIAENTSFYLIAVILAFSGLGIQSYAWAVIFRSLLGLVWLYHASPWPIGFAFSVKAIKKLFRFGIPFQLNSFIAVVKDRIPNVLVAKYIGLSSFGLLSWAQKGPRAPLSFMDAIQRVTFPTFARLQDNRDLLAASIKKSLFFIALFIFPALAGIALIAPNVVHLIPKYTKWEPAILPLYFYSISFAIAAVTTPLTNAFNAVGKITITTALMIMWTVLTWIFYPFLSLRFNYMGTASAALIVGASSFIVWYIARRLFHFSPLKTIFHPLFACLIMIIVAFPINRLIPQYLPNFIAKILISGGSYCLYQWLFCRQEINWFIKQLKCYLVKK